MSSDEKGKIKKILLQHLNGLCDSKKLEIFIDMLLDGDWDHQRLALCLAIDLEHAVIPAGTVAKIIDLMRVPHISLVDEFDQVLEDNRSLIIDSNYTDESYPKDTYSTIFDVEVFINYYLSSVTTNDIKYVLHLLESGNVVELRKILKTTITLTGTKFKELAWVLPYKVIEYEFTQLSASEERASKIADNLGKEVTPSSTTDNEKSHLIVCKYPVTFDTKCYQPSSIHALWRGWHNGLYLSYRKDNGYGKTYATCGSRLGYSERVHRKIVVNSSGFEFMYIGESAPIAKRIENIIPEGFSRI